MRGEYCEEGIVVGRDWSRDGEVEKEMGEGSQQWNFGEQDRKRLQDFLAQPDQKKCLWFKQRSRGNLLSLLYLISALWKEAEERGMETAGGLIYSDIWGRENTEKTAILLGGKKERQKEKVKKIRFEGYDQEFLYLITKAEEIHDLKYLLCSKLERITFAIHEF